MHIYSDKERWHSAQCHLCVRGRHHRNMHGTGVHSLLGCDLSIWQWKSVALFHVQQRRCNDASCGAIKAMELWNVPIAIWSMAPLENHIRAYICHAVGGDATKLLSPPSEGEGGSHSATGNPHLGGGTPCFTSRQSLETSQTKSCINSWRISARRLHSTSCMHPPAILNQHLGENYQAAGILMGMTRRSLFWQGEGGFPQDNHPYLTAPAWPDGVWVPQGPPPQPPRPAPPNPDVGCLISMLALGLHLGTTRNKHLQWWGYAR